MGGRSAQQLAAQNAQATQAAQANQAQTAAQMAEEERAQQAGLGGQGLDPDLSEYEQQTPEQRRKARAEKIRNNVHHAYMYDWGLPADYRELAAERLAKLNPDQQEKVLKSKLFRDTLADNGWIKNTIIQAVAQPDQFFGFLLGLLIKKIIQRVAMNKLKNLAKQAQSSEESALEQANEGADTQFDAKTKAGSPTAAIDLGADDPAVKAAIEGQANRFWGARHDGQPVKLPPKVFHSAESAWVDEQRAKAIQSLDTSATDFDEQGNRLSADKRTEKFFKAFNEALDSPNLKAMWDRMPDPKETFKQYQHRMAVAVVGDLGEGSELLLDAIEQRRKKGVEQGATFAHRLDFDPSTLRADSAAEAAAREVLDAHQEFGLEQVVPAYWQTQLGQAQAATDPTKAVMDLLQTVKGRRDIPSEQRHTAMVYLVTEQAKTLDDTAKLAFYRALKEQNVLMDSEPLDEWKQKIILDSAKAAGQGRVVDATQQGQLGRLFNPIDPAPGASEEPLPYHLAVGCATPPAVAPGQPVEKSALQNYFDAAKDHLFQRAQGASPTLTPKEAREAYYELVAKHNALMDERYQAACTVALNAGNSPPAKSPNHTFTLTMTWPEFQNLKAEIGAKPENERKELMSERDKKLMNQLLETLPESTQQRRELEEFLRNPKHFDQPAPTPAATRNRGLPNSTPLPGQAPVSQGHASLAAQQQAEVLRRQMAAGGPSPGGS